MDSKIKDLKNIWNKQVSAHITYLLDFKQMFNGHPGSLLKEKTSISKIDAVKIEELIGLLNSISKSFEDINSIGSNIITAQQNQTKVASKFKTVIDSKKSWNASSKEFIIKLIQFKRLVNGFPNSFVNEKSNINNPIPGNPQKILSDLNSLNNNLVISAKEILKQQLLSIKPSVKTASNPLTRMWHGIKSFPKLFMSDDQLTAYKTSLVTGLGDLKRKTRDIESDILNPQLDEQSITNMMSLTDSMYYVKTLAERIKEHRHELELTRQTTQTPDPVVPGKVDESIPEKTNSDKDTKDSSKPSASSTSPPASPKDAIKQPSSESSQQSGAGSNAPSNKPEQRVDIIEEARKKYKDFKTYFTKNEINDSLLGDAVKFREGLSKANETMENDTVPHAKKVKAANVINSIYKSLVEKIIGLFEGKSLNIPKYEPGEFFKTISDDGTVDFYNKTQQLPNKPSESKPKSNNDQSLIDIAEEQALDYLDNIDALPEYLKQKIIEYKTNILISLNDMMDAGKDISERVKDANSISLIYKNMVKEVSDILLKEKGIDKSDIPDQTKLMHFFKWITSYVGISKSTDLPVAQDSTPDSVPNKDVPKDLPTPAKPTLPTVEIATTKPAAQLTPKDLTEKVKKRYLDFSKNFKPTDANKFVANKFSEQEIWKNMKSFYIAAVNESLESTIRHPAKLALIKKYDEFVGQIKGAASGELNVPAGDDIFSIIESRNITTKIMEKENNNFISSTLKNANSSYIENELTKQAYLIHNPVSDWIKKKLNYLNFFDPTMGDRSILHDNLKKIRLALNKALDAIEYGTVASELTEEKMESLSTILEKYRLTLQQSTTIVKNILNKRLPAEEMDKITRQVRRSKVKSM